MSSSEETIVRDRSTFQAHYNTYKCGIAGFTTLTLGHACTRVTKLRPDLLPTHLTKYQPLNWSLLCTPNKHFKNSPVECLQTLQLM